MEASLQELKASPRMVPRAVYLPNCDRKGFYKRKQVRPHLGPLRAGGFHKRTGQETSEWYLAY